jgi:hypothetical protein
VSRPFALPGAATSCGKPEPDNLTELVRCRDIGKLACLRLFTWDVSNGETVARMKAAGRASFGGRLVEAGPFERSGSEAEADPSHPPFASPSGQSMRPW